MHKLFIGLVCLTMMIQPTQAAEQTRSNAQNPCSSREKMVNLLSKRYLEMPRAIGLVSSRGVIELFVAKSGSWTMLITNTSGKACILAAGKYWQAVGSKQSGNPV
ncbi:MAG: hypothetical protein JKY49_02080 [Cohaesibacteraceae bacterium]|nr:hypothetical protein [Cohaesibacteraceae bacterium]